MEKCRTSPFGPRRRRDRDEDGALRTLLVVSLLTLLYPAQQAVGRRAAFPICIHALFPIGQISYHDRLSLHERNGARKPLCPQGISLARNCLYRLWSLSEHTRMILETLDRALNHWAQIKATGSEMTPTCLRSAFPSTMPDTEPFKACRCPVHSNWEIGAIGLNRNLNLLYTTHPVFIFCIHPLSAAIPATALTIAVIFSTGTSVFP